jgi:hypothetical protein
MNGGAMNKEVWKDIPWANGEYMVSSFGRVLALPRVVNFGCQVRTTEKKILSQISNGHGYFYVNIYGKKYYVHRLVAEAFIDNPLDLPQINHKDENRSNNCADNLEWCTAKYNANYGSHNEKLKRSIRAKYAVINLETGVVYSSPIEVQEILGIHHDGISRCCREGSGTAGGFHWRYVDES